MINGVTASCGRTPFSASLPCLYRDSSSCLTTWRIHPYSFHTLTNMQKQQKFQWMFTDFPTAAHRTMDSARQQILLKAHLQLFFFFQRHNDKQNHTLQLYVNYNGRTICTKTNTYKLQQQIAVQCSFCYSIVVLFLFPNNLHGVQSQFSFTCLKPVTTL